MKIIYLNVEQGKREAPLLNFIQCHAEITDIFCFQESVTNIYNKIQILLPNFIGFIEEKDVTEIGLYSIATFVNKKHKIKNKDRILNGESNLGLSNFSNVKLNLRDVQLINVHGIPLPGDKKDTEGRINQSKEILDFVSIGKTPTIIGGDFNLLPNTKSIKMFESHGFKDLIKGFKIKTTRSNNAWKESKERNKGNGLLFFGRQNFADYVFVSPELKVNSFEVPNIEVSDHLPLILDFEVV